MKRPHLAFGALLLLCIVSATSFHTFAYTPYGWKWNRSRVDYFVNPANLDVAADAAVAAIQSAASAWTTQSTTSFGFSYAGYTSSTTVANNARNEVFFRNATNGSAIATTYYWSSGTTALDADIVFWDGAYQFFAGSTGCSNGFYIEDVATHEFGHALGLGHSPVSDATMVSGQTYCGTYKRSLALDDVQAVEALYPGGVSNTAPTVSIGAPVSGAGFSSASAITFSGSAQDVEDGALTGSIRWTSSLDGLLGTGGVLSKALRAGSHVITASVIDSGGATQTSSVSIAVTDAAANPGVVLTATSSTMKKGFPRVDLRWTVLATWPSIDVYRNGVLIVAKANTGAYADTSLPKGSATYTYKVCNASSATCSNNVTASF